MEVIAGTATKSASPGAGGSEPGGAMWWQREGRMPAMEGEAHGVRPVRGGAPN